MKLKELVSVFDIFSLFTLCGVCTITLMASINYQLSFWGILHEAMWSIIFLVAKLCKCGWVLISRTPKGNNNCSRYLECEILGLKLQQNTPKGNDFWFKYWKVWEIEISLYSNDHFSKKSAGSSHVELEDRNPAGILIPWPVSTCFFTYLFISLNRK